MTKTLQNEPRDVLRPRLKARELQLCILTDFLACVVGGHSSRSPQGAVRPAQPWLEAYELAVSDGHRFRRPLQRGHQQVRVAGPPAPEEPRRCRGATSRHRDRRPVPPSRLRRVRAARRHHLLRTHRPAAGCRHQKRSPQVQRYRTHTDQGPLSDFLYVMQWSNQGEAISRINKTILFTSYSICH